MKNLLVTIVLLVLFGLAQSRWIDTVYTSVLTGNQKLPSQGYLNSFGTAVCVYQRNTNPKTIDCEVSHNVQSPTYAALYRGTPTSVGPALYQFTVLLTPVFRQAFALDTVLNNYTFANQELDFLNGAWYIGISSYLYSQGEIRGQLLHNSRFYSRLTYQHINPPTQGSNAQGIAVANYSPYLPQRLLQISISHSVQNPISASIFFGIPELASAPLTKFESPQSPIQASIDLSVVEAVYMLSDLTYIEINSKLNSYANVRGAINTIDVPPTISFTSRLSGANLNPPTPSTAIGCALFYYDCTTRVIEYFVVHTVEGATQARIEQVITGEPNRVVTQLVRAESPIYGSFQLTAEQEFRLLNYTFQLNILSYSYPNGEILGNINSDWKYYAYLSGTYVIPPRTTSAVGCATFNLLPDHSFNYEIVTNVIFPRGIDFTIGQAGQNGDASILNPGSNRTLSGTVVLKGVARRALTAEDLYVQVRSALYPEGVIRGQIYSLDLCLLEVLSENVIPSSASNLSVSIVVAVLMIVLCLLS